MKLTIWQQFSSNHSASYTVVGVFASVQEAKQARQKIMAIHEENANWYRDRDLYPLSLKKPSPIEAKYAAQYGFDWKEELDWAWYHPEKPIAHFDRLVIVDTRTVDTWQTGHQFVNLLSAMGADVYRYVTEGRDPQYKREEWGHTGNFYTNFDYEIDCMTPDIQSASNLLNHLKQIFERKTSYLDKEPMEWLYCHPELENYTAEQVHELESQYLSEYGNSERVLSQEQRLFISHCRSDVSISAYKNTTFEQIQNRVIIKKLHVSNLAIGFQTFFKYLKSLGCEKVDYKFTQRPTYLYEDGEYKDIDG